MMDGMAGGIGAEGNGEVGGVADLEGEGIDCHVRLDELGRDNVWEMLNAFDVMICSCG